MPKSLTLDLLKPYRVYQAKMLVTIAVEQHDTLLQNVGPDLLERRRRSLMSTPFAISMWEVFSQKRAYNNCVPGTIHLYVLNGDRPSMDDIADPFPEPVLELMQNCWAHSPENRPTFGEASNILSIHLLPDQFATPKMKDSISEGGEAANLFWS